MPLWMTRALVSALLTTAFLTFYLHQGLRPLHQHPYIKYNLDTEEPTDGKQFCILPRIHPFDPSVLNYHADPKPIQCTERQKTLTIVNSSCHLSLNEEGRKIKNTLSCEYREIIRCSGSDYELDLTTPRALPPEGVSLSRDFVEVQCYGFGGISVYYNVHACVVKKQNSKLKRSVTKPLNVFIFGVDSVSRLHFIRQLPMTYQYLTEKMGAVVFRGMTKIGDNTFPNLMALLTGHSEEELKDSPDEWPFIWKTFASRGYATMFAEDKPDIGLFVYRQSGLRNQPTDHYLRPFWMMLERSWLHHVSSPLCYGGVSKHMLQLDYVRDFVFRYRNRPHFGFSFLVELGHDHLNKVGVADEDFSEWFRKLYESGSFNQTVLVVVSDHGHRFNQFSRTPVGRVEERMPFLAIKFPEDILSTGVRDNLRMNQGRLVTHYDIHATLLDALNYAQQEVWSPGKVSGRGISLLGRVPPNRSCESAAIPAHYCVCDVRRQLSTVDVRALDAASAVVNSLNDRTQGTSKCAVLSLDRIERLEILMPNVKNEEEERLRVILEVKPSAGLFEATVLRNLQSGNYSVLGDVSRINPYGNQSWCIRDPVLKKYCYCS